MDGVEPRLVTVTGAPDRDPRKHVVSIVYHVQIEPSAKVEAGDDAATANWYNLKKVWTDTNTFKLAFDHRDILAEYIKQNPKL